MPLTQIEFQKQLSELIFELSAGAKLDFAILKSLENINKFRSFPYNFEEIKLRTESSFKVSRRKVSSDVKEVFSDLNPKNDLPIVVLDLDETLCHVYYDFDDFDHRLSPRPLVEAFIQLLHASGIELVVWTAGLQHHALSALELIDPMGCIQHVIHRPREQQRDIWWSEKYSYEFCNRKALALVPPELLSRIIMIDDNPNAVAHPSSIIRSLVIPKYSSTGVVNGLMCGDPPLDFELLPKLFLLLKLTLAAKFTLTSDFCTAKVLQEMHAINWLKEVNLHDINKFYIVDLDSFPDIGVDNIQETIAYLLPKERLPIFRISSGDSAARTEKEDGVMPSALIPGVVDTRPMLVRPS